MRNISKNILLLSLPLTTSLALADDGTFSRNDLKLHCPANQDPVMVLAIKSTKKDKPYVQFTSQGYAPNTINEFNLLCVEYDSATLKGLSISIVDPNPENSVFFKYDDFLKTGYKVVRHYPMYGDVKVSQIKVSSTPAATATQQYFDFGVLSHFNVNPFGSHSFINIPFEMVWSAHMKRWRAFIGGNPADAVLFRLGSWGVTHVTAGACNDVREPLDIDWCLHELGTFTETFRTPLDDKSEIKALYRKRLE